VTLGLPVEPQVAIIIGLAVLLITFVLLIFGKVL